ncbi:MAG: ArsR/SmtB family transcription factor [Petrotogales bacterium]
MTRLVEILKVLSDETRFKIIKLLAKNSFCVGALAKRLRITESAVSQHLKILKNVDLVHAEKQGYYTHYTVKQYVLKNVANEISRLSDSITSNNKKCLSKTSKGGN